MKAKFWIWKNDGWVKLKLEEGQKVRHFSGFAHEEGWSSTTETFWFDGRKVWSHVVNDGRDCDGRLTTEDLFFCRSYDLQDVEVEGRPPTPRWHRERSEVYDEYAQAMGF